jgi:translation initiation factor 1 (eIF-1/SUI1)
MEVIKILKQDLQDQYADCEQLQQIIVRLETQAESQGKVICMVKVNGLNLSTADEERLATTARDKIDEIEIQLSQSARLVDDSVKVLADFLQALSLRVQTAAEQFRNTTAPPTQHLFSEIVQSTHLLTDALLTLKPNLLARAQDKTTYEQAWVAAEAHFMQTIRELAVAYQKQDFVLVSDVLEYELYNSIEKWREIIYQ